MFIIYWHLLQQITHDVVRLFKNFWHWNLSKIVIFTVTLLTGLVVSLPFIGGIWWIVNKIVGGLGISVIQDLITTGVLSNTVVDQLIRNHWLMGVLMIGGVMIFAIMTSMMTYGYYLTIKVYQSYMQGGRLNILKNDYFSLSHIWKFLGILGWSSLYLMIPILYAFVGAGILMYLTTGIGLITSRTIIGGIVFTGTLIFLFYFVKIAIQVMFSYIFMLEKDALKTPALELVRRSIQLAKGNILQIIALLLPFAVMVAFGGVMLQNIKEFRDIRVLEDAANTAVLTNPSTYINDHTFIQREFLNEERLDEAQKGETLAINNAFNPKTNGIDTEYIKAIYPYIMLSGTLDSTSDILWQIGMSLISFFLFEGVMLMVYFSIYHILIAEIENEVSEIKSTEATFGNLWNRLKNKKSEVEEKIEVSKNMNTETKKVAKKKVTTKKVTSKKTEVKKPITKK